MRIRNSAAEAHPGAAEAPPRAAEAHNGAEGDSPWSRGGSQ
jgi:hypothetical protein